MNNLNQFDVKKTLKQGLIYMLIALPFMLIIGVFLTIINAPYFLTLSATVIVGGCVVFVCFIIHSKREEKRKIEKENNPSNKFDPFKD